MSEQPPGETFNAEAAPAQPRIWAGSWLDYNAGILHGAWLAADRDAEEISSDIARMLAASPTTARTGEVAEEWGIFDFDNFGPLRLGESEDLEWLSQVARGIAEYGPAYAAWADLVPREEGGGDFADVYRGHYDSVEAFVDELLEDTGLQASIDSAVPESLRSYVRIDTAMLGRDLQLEGSITAVEAVDGGVWIFTEE